MSITNVGGHVHTIEESGPIRPTRRRRHSKEFKTQAIRAASQPGISIAAVALHYRLNANLLRRWVADQEELDAAEEMRKSLSSPSAEFVPLHIGGAGVTHSMEEIQIEVRRGATTITIRWPVSGAGECALWLQGWLR